MAEFKVWVSETALREYGESAERIRLLLLKSLSKYYEPGDYSIEEIDI